jgi:cytidyltransferase-like protein
MVFGTFDVFHKGHEFYFEKAKEHGNRLIVIVARDETVQKIKGILPKNSQNQRLKALQASSYVNLAVLGNLGDKFRVIEDYNPDVLVFGYDQRSFNIGIENELQKRGLTHIKLVQIHESLHPNIYKSSLLNKSSKIH